MTASLDQLYRAWRQLEFPRKSSDADLEELHADIALADHWVTEAVVPYVTRSKFTPARIDLIAELARYEARAAALAARLEPEEQALAARYSAYIEAQRAVYAAFLERAPASEPDA